MKQYYACLICTAGLAVASSAPAEIIWSGEQNLSDQVQYIDLNSDSIVNLLIIYSISGNTSLSSNPGGLLNAHIDGPDIDGTNRILIDSSSVFNAALPYGTLISDTPAPALEWAGGKYFSGLVSRWYTDPPEPDTEWRGLLGENENTYIGISFEVEGSTHYAWINIALGPEGFLGFEDPITTSWAYESTPDTAIVAGAVPEPSTGILTMLGSLALLFRARSRRRGNHRT